MMRHVPPPPVPVLLQRRVPVAMCAVIVAITMMAAAGPGWPQVLLGLLTDGPFLLAWLAGAVGFGSLFFRLPPRPRPTEAMATTPGATHVDVARVAPPPPAVQSLSIPSAGPVPILKDVVGLGPLKFVTAIALGLGLMSLATLALGLAGLMTRPIAFVMIALGVAIGLVKLVRADFTPANISNWLSIRSTWSWLWLAAAPIIGVVLVASYAPPGVLWGSAEPNGYDVLEYHLQVPREWYEAGRIHRLDHNVFGYFPQGVETHFYLAMQLRGGPWAGMYLAQLMHVAITLLAGVATFAAAAAVAPRAQATVAGVAAMGTPWLALLAPMAYNEGGLLLHGTLAIGWSQHAMMRGPAPRWIGVFAPRLSMWTETPHQDRLTTRAAARDVLLAAMCAGFACGVKLTAGPLLLVGVPFALIAAGIGFRPLMRIGIACVVIGVIGLIVFSPWAIRNVAWARNPVFPEANSIFKSDRFSPVQDKRWKIAHAATDAQKSFPMRLRAARDQILFDWRFGYALIPLALIALFLTRGRPETWFLGALLMVMLVFWLAVTHLQGRFFVLAIPVAAMLIAQFERRIHVIASAVLIVAQAMFAIGAVAGHERMDLLRKTPALLGIDLGRPLVLENVPEDAPVDLVGDARAFMYPVPMSRLRYRTVFDVNAKPDQPIVQAWLGSAPRDDAYILVDPIELRRLSATYLAIPNLPPDAPGASGDPFVIPPHSAAAR
jgi:hypothetical protein